MKVGKKKLSSAIINIEFVYIKPVQLIVCACECYSFKFQLEWVMDNIETLVLFIVLVHIVAILTCDHDNR